MQKVTCTLIPDYSTGKVASYHSSTQRESGQSNAFFLPHLYICLWLSWFKFPFSKFLWHCLTTVSKPKPALITVSVRLCVCLQMSTLISTWACCLLLRCSGSENKQSSSYLAWAGKVDSAEQAALGGKRTSTGVNAGCKNMDESRAKSNAMEKQCTGS